MESNPTPLVLTGEQLQEGLDQLSADALPQDNVTVSSIPISFQSASELEYYIQHLEYYDENLHVLPEKVEQLELGVTPESAILQLSQEMWVVHRLLTIQRQQTTKPELKTWMKKKLTQAAVHWDDPTSEILQLSRMGSHMSLSDWDQYETVFNTLFELHKDKLAHSPLTPVEPDPRDN